jgi:hypothetical protein
MTIDPYARRDDGPERMRAHRERFDEQWPEAISALAEQENRLREFIQRHPLAVVGGALVLGFIAARAMREA